MQDEASTSGHPGDERSNALGRSYELLNRYQAGDNEALGELIARYTPRLHRLARRRMSSAQRKLGGGSMDVVQDTFLSALHNLGDFEFRDARSLTRYLSVILRNHLNDLSKKANRRPPEYSMERSGDDGAESTIEAVSRDPLPYEKLSHDEFQEILAECTTAMSTEERDVLLLREVGGASWQEVADECGSPTPHAAEMRYNRAKTKRDVRLMRRVKF